MKKYIFFTFILVFTGCSQKVFQGNNTNTVAINASNVFYIETYSNNLKICYNELEDSCTYSSYKNKEEAQSNFYAFLKNYSLICFNRPIIETKESLKYFNPNKIYKVELVDNLTLNIHTNSQKYISIKFPSKEAKSEYYDKLLTKF